MRKYDSYKDSGVEWIGEIPNHWKKLKPWTLFQPEKRVPLEGDNIVTCFRDGVVTLRRKRREDGFTISLKEIGYQRILVGDLVVHEMDGFEGSIGVSDSDGKSTPVYTVISEGYNHNNRYWMYLLREMSRSRFIESLSKSIRERTTEFRWNTWKTQFFINPPLSEQQQIVSFLDTKTSLIDSLIEKTQRKIELLKEKRTSLINEVVTKGLNPNVEMKDSGVEWIGEIPSSWELRKGSTIGNYSKGKGIKKDEVKETGLPCIRYGEIYTKYNHKFESVETFIDEGITDIKVKKGTLFMTGSGELLEDIGKCVVYVGNGEIYVGGDIIILKPFNEFDSEFLSYQINSECVRIQREQNGRGGIIVHIYSKNFKDMWFPKPPLSEQKEIVSYLDEQTQLIDKTISIEEKRIELLKEYRQSLISEVVTGKLKVTTDE